MATAVLPLGQNLSRISNPNKKTKCRLTVLRTSVSLGARVQDFLAARVASNGRRRSRTMRLTCLRTRLVINIAAKLSTSLV